MVTAAGNLFLATTGEGDIYCSRDGQHWDLSFHSPVGPYLTVAASPSDLVISAYPNGLFHAKRMNAPRYVTLSAEPNPAGLRITIRGENVKRVELQLREYVTDTWTKLTTLDLTSNSAEWIVNFAENANTATLYRALIIE
jgi:hypothetical protein